MSPVAWLPNLSRELGLDVWVKDDSRHGQPYGGNKARKLELILADARRVGADSVVTFGATRSHHALATAIYARLAGVHAMLVVTDSFGNDPDGTHVARLRDLGATVLQTRTLVGAVLRTLAVTLLPRGARPYVIPPGASMPLGTLGYVNAGLELAAQVAAGELPEPARIYVALGSGGTTAGLLLGLRLAGLRSQLCPVMVTRMGGRTAGLWVSWLANRGAGLLRGWGAAIAPGRLVAADLAIDAGQVGAGYGVATEAGREATRLAAADSLVLDEVYTAKAMASLVRDARRGQGPVLFWHTLARAEDPA